MHNSRVYITNGLQDKAPFVQAWMGKNQTFTLKDKIPVKDDVKVECPGAETNAAGLSP